MFAYEVKNIIVGTNENANPANGLILKSTDGDINQLPFNGYMITGVGEPETCPDSCVCVYVEPDFDEYSLTGNLKPIIGFQPDYHFVQFSDEFMKESGIPKDVFYYFKSLKVFAYEGEELVLDGNSKNWVKGIFFKAVTCPEECTKAKDDEQVVAIVSEKLNFETNEWEKVLPVIDEYTVKEPTEQKLFMGDWIGAGEQSHWEFTKITNGSTIDFGSAFPADIYNMIGLFAEDEPHIKVISCKVDGVSYESIVEKKSEKIDDLYPFFVFAKNEFGTVFGEYEVVLNVDGITFTYTIKLEPGED